MKHSVQLAAVVSGLLFCKTAVADGDKQAADLYEQGVAAYGSGSLDEACPKFKESFAKGRQPAPLFMLAKCEEKRGRIASALEHFEEVLRLGGLEPELQDQAALSVTSLGPRVPRVTLQQGSAPESARVSINQIPRVVGSRALLLDPGSHELRVEAPGHEPKTSSFTLAESEQKQLALEIGAKLPAAPPTRQPEESNAGWFVGAAIAFGIGGAGFIAAGVTGGIILDSCGGSFGCETRTDGDPSDGLLAANYLGWGLGALGAVTGVVLVAVGASVAGDTPTESVRLVPGPGELGLGLYTSF